MIVVLVAASSSLFSCGSKPKPPAGVCYYPHAAKPIPAAAWLSALVTLELQQGGMYATRDCRRMPVWIPPASERCREASRDVPRATPVGAESVIERILPDERRLIWLITHRFANGDGYGPLALARVLPEGLSIESLGRLRSRTDRVALELWRIRQERVVVATAEACAADSERTACPRAARILLEHGGYLVEPPIAFADGRCVGEPFFELKQREEAQASSGERRRYEMTTTLGHDARYIVVNERIVVSELDPARPQQAREIQRVDADRFIHVDRGRFFTQQWPLWPRMVPPAKTR